MKWMKWWEKGHENECDDGDERIIFSTLADVYALCFFFNL